MTQEQRKATLKAEAKFYDVDDFDLTSNFSFGIEHTLSNPTDFGLVSMETMFEFCQWASESGFRLNPIFKRWQRMVAQYTTPELFQLFTQNKEK